MRPKSRAVTPFTCLAPICLAIIIPTKRVSEGLILVSNVFFSLPVFAASLKYETSDCSDTILNGNMAAV